MSLSEEIRKWEELDWKAIPTDDVKKIIRKCFKRIEGRIDHGGRWTSEEIMFVIKEEVGEELSK